MNKKFVKTAEESRKDKLNKISTWFMCLAVVSLLLMLMLLCISGITPSVWMTFGIAVAFLALGLIFGITYLKMAFPLREKVVDDG
jgi:uncharacterized ion transporter superfamily protein YfcC